jgi:hypothetical protein
MEKADKKRDKYLLLAYAYSKQNTIMNASSPVLLTEITNEKGFETDGVLVLGNLSLTRDSLDTLYKYTNKDLRFTPFDYSAQKKYISYWVSNMMYAEKDSQPMNYVQRRIDPCPPAVCTFQ